MERSTNTLVTFLPSLLPLPLPALLFPSPPLPLSSHLLGHKTITRLGLVGNRLTDRGVDMILSLATLCPSLCSCTLTENGFPFASIQLVKSTLSTPFDVRMAMKTLEQIGRERQVGIADLVALEQSLTPGMYVQGRKET